jgi:hypothetical protein
MKKKEVFGRNDFYVFEVLALFMAKAQWLLTLPE